MQFAKDSFFLALQQRLGALNPARTVLINGTTVPAVITIENLPPSSGETQPNAFYIEWSAANVLVKEMGDRGLMSMECVISYYTYGSVQSMVDRGRVLGELDHELLSICQPPNTEKRDYTQAPSADLGTRVFWSQPALEEGKKDDVVNDAQRHTDSRVQRRAQTTIYFFPEATLL